MCVRAATFRRAATMVAAAYGIVLASTGCRAAPLTVASYAMNNGWIGSYNYLDTSYSPCPASSCTTIEAPLSGGTGKLTDGVSPSLDWYQTGMMTSWVGWDETGPGGLDPTITFYFPTLDTINSITVWVSNSLTGGVAQPGSISVDGTNIPIAPDTVDTTPHDLTFSGLDVTGTSVTLQFFQATGYYWVMIGEVSFSGTVPEPASLALFGTGLAGLGLARRRSFRR